MKVTRLDRAKEGVFNSIEEKIQTKMGKQKLREDICMTTPAVIFLL